MDYFTGLPKNYIKREVTIDGFKHEGYFTKLELDKANLLFCSLLFYVNDYGFDDIDKKHLYNRLLLIFNRILKFYFRAPLKLTEWQINSLNKALAEYSLFRNALTGRGFNAPEDIDKRNYSHLLIELYRDLDSLMAEFRAGNIQHQLDIKDFDRTKPPFNEVDYSAIRFMQNQIKNKLSEQIDFFLIQGSYATADFVRDWSDLDTHVILNGDVFKDVKVLEYTQKELQKLSLLCYKINPLAHHTFFIYPDIILRHYLNVFLPLQVLEYSLALHQKGYLIVRQADSRLETFNDFWGSSAHFRKKVAGGDYSKNILDWENDLSGIMMLPTLALQAIGKPMYKKFSFEKIKEVFPDFDHSLIDWASQKRKEWKLFNALRLYPNVIFNLLPAGFNNYLFNKYRFYLLRFKETPDFREVEDFTKKALNLYETTFHKCLKDYKSKKNA